MELEPEDRPIDHAYSDGTEVSKAFHNKMRFKGYTYEGGDQLIHAKSFDILERSWMQSLGYQFQSLSLPDIDTL
jgi:hypothetical protein